MHNIRPKDNIVYKWSVPDLVYSKIHKKNWKDEIPNISIYQGKIIYDQKIFDMHKIRNHYCWVDESDADKLYGIIIPQRQGTQFRIIMKRNDAIMTMYASLKGTYTFEVENRETHQKTQFSLKYTYVEEGEYLLEKFILYHHINGEKKELPNVRVRMITISENENIYLGMDIQFKEKTDDIGRLRLQFDNAHQIAKIKGWKSSMALFKDKPEYEGAANSVSSTLPILKEMFQNHRFETQQLTKENIDFFSAQMDSMLAEEPLYIESLYAVPQPAHFIDVSKVIQDTMRDMAYAQAPDFILDYLRVERPEVEEKYAKIKEDDDVKKFLSNFMKMYMNQNWANDKHLSYSEYVREVDNYENKINYYWNGDDETSMALDPGYLKLIDVIEVKTYFDGILEIEPFLRDPEKWNLELYKYFHLPEISAEICAEIEQSDMSKSGHMDYIFKCLSHKKIDTIDKKNCYYDSDNKENAPMLNATAAYRHLLLNRQLNDSLLFLEGKDYQVDVDKMYKISEFISERLQLKQNVVINQDEVKSAIDSFLGLLNSEPMINCGICLYESMNQLSDSLIKKILFLTAIAMWNDNFTSSYQIPTDGLNYEVYQSIYDGIEIIISKNQDLYHKIFNENIDLNDLFAAMEHIASLFFYTQAINKNVLQENVLHYLNIQTYSKKLIVGIPNIPTIVLMLVNAVSLGINLSRLSDSDIVWEDAVEILKDISCVAAGTGIFLNLIYYTFASELAVSWIPAIGAVLAVIGICSSLISVIISLVSPSKMEEYAKNDCVEFLKGINDPSQEWVDDFNERMKKIVQKIYPKNKLVFS